MKLSIENDETYAYMSKVKLDDQDISNAVLSLNLGLQAGSVPVCRLELRIINITELQDVTDRYLIPTETQALLKQLGWTPPHKGDTFQVTRSNKDDS